ncbi:hypothetical protein [Ramlibacter sp. AN1133]|uniref:hypothetical protein n=1 Tax=Ramlibacter sp. AN1133 TaxID=3133429 RepID=UPI0030C41726
MLNGAEEAMCAVAAVFAEKARDQAHIHPVICEPIGCDADFGVKAGASVLRPLLGVTSGGCWPGDSALGLTNHQSTAILFDADTGSAVALVSAVYLTALRSAAAAAIATQALARPDSTSLGIIGCGSQAMFQLDATLLVRPIERVCAWDPCTSRLQDFGRQVVALGLAFEVKDCPRNVAGAAGVLVTLTPSGQALIEHGWMLPVRVSTRWEQTDVASTSSPPRRWPQRRCSWTRRNGLCGSANPNTLSPRVRSSTCR